MISRPDGPNCTPALLLFASSRKVTTLALTPAKDEAPPDGFPVLFLSSSISGDGVPPLLLF